MQVQTAAFFANDPLMLPCIVAQFQEALTLLGSAGADAVGVGRFEAGEPLVSKVRPPMSRDLGAVLSAAYGNAVLAAAVRDNKGLHTDDLQPFRYRNWLSVMAGPVRLFEPADGTRLAIPNYIAQHIKGHTVPEVLFHQFLAYLHRQGLLAGERYDLAPLRKALAAALSHDQVWFGEAGAENSLLLTDGRILLGATLDRPLYVRLIDGLSGCVACGADVDGLPVEHPHVRGAVVVDTERLPSDAWQTVGPRRIFQVDTRLRFESFEL